MNALEQQLIYLLEKKYGIEGQISQIAGGDDLNFLLVGRDAQKYIIKLANPEKDKRFIQSQIQALIHLESKKTGLNLPVPIQQIEEDYLAIIDTAEGNRCLYVLSYVEGIIYVDYHPQDDTLLYSLGKSLGILTTALLDFSHPSAKYYFDWCPSNPEWCQDHASLFNEDQKLIEYFLSLYESNYKDKVCNLRKSIIYNDANEHNVLVSKPPKHGVNGFIDFGDIQDTYVINEVAIACAYGAMDKKNPLHAAAKIVKGFHEVLPLAEEELYVLYSLIANRLVISLTNSQIKRQSQSTNSHFFISEQKALSLLKIWRTIHPEFAECAFRHAAGYEPAPGNKNLVSFFNKNEKNFSPLLKEKITPENSFVFDWSVGSPYVDMSIFELKSFIDPYNIIAGLGKYDEYRPVYTSDSFERIGDFGPEWRTLHLGLDVFQKPGSEIHSPLDGVVHSFADNAGDRNYGPTIILQHSVEGLNFYTLYGHLSRSSLKEIERGQEIKCGEPFTQIGGKHENGGWVPHLHFQIMTSMFDFDGDFPGVAYPSEREMWLSISPNPGLITGMADKICGEPDRPEELLARRKKRTGPNVGLSYSNPLHIVRGSMQYLFDQTGRKYLDSVNNVAHVGHEHPQVVRAIQQQSALLNTNARYLHSNLVEYTELLTSLLPDPLNVCYFVNSGSEANELALRIAKTVTGTSNCCVFEGAYHGNTNGAIELSPYKFHGKGGQGQSKHIRVFPLPNVEETQISAYVERCESLLANDKKAGSFFFESILSCAGQIVPPKELMQRTAGMIKKRGGLLIADEVQIGFGRLGSSMWGFELHDLLPDIVTLGKPIGNGYPIGAVVTSRAIADSFDNGMEFFSTYGGNPVACAAGMAVINVLNEENLREKALETGLYFIEKLNELKKSNPIISDVRGSGLFLGFELRNEEKQPLPSLASYLSNQAKKRGLLISVDGIYGNVIKIKPPMCFNKMDVDFYISTVSEIFQHSIMKSKLQ